MLDVISNNEQLKDWCSLHQLLPEEAAKVLGLSRSMIYKYLNGTAGIMEYVQNQCLLIDLLPVENQQQYIRHKLAQTKNDCSNDKAERK